MKRMKKCTIALSMLLTGVAMTGCGQTPTSSVQESINFSLSEVPNAIYGDEIDFTTYVKLPAGFVGSVSCTSLTPETITIDMENPSVALVTGVGACKVQVTVGGTSKTAEFTSYASVKSIRVKTPTTSFEEGATISLDDYVTVNVANPTSAKGVYVAVNNTPEVAEILDDGKSVKFVASGEFSIVISDVANKNRAYFEGKVISPMQVKLEALAKLISDNYRVYNMSNGGDLSLQYPFIHTDNYTFYPYGAIASNWTDNEHLYSGMFCFPNTNTVYNANFGVTADFLPDVNNISWVERGSYGKERYWSFDDLDTSVFSQFKSHKNLDGEEDYLVADYSTSIREALFENPLGLSSSATTYDSVRLNFSTMNGDEGIVLSYIKNNQVANKKGFFAINKADLPAMTTFVNTASNEPQPINTDELQTYIKGIIDGKNYTIEGRTYLGSDDGSMREWSVEEAFSKFGPLHTYYYTGSAKYTEDKMFVRNYEAFKVEGFKEDRQKTHAYKNEEGKVYEYKTETKEIESGTSTTTVEVTNGALTKETTPVVGSDGNEISDYRANPAMNGLDDINFADFDQFKLLDLFVENDTYNFTIGESSTKGSAVLRNFANALVPEMTGSLFPTSTGSNNAEAASFGKGYLQKTSTGFKFGYYVDYAAENTLTGGTVTYLMHIEYEVKDVGTTTITEF